MKRIRKFIFETQSIIFSYSFLFYKLYLWKYFIKRNKAKQYQQIFHINTFHCGGGAAKVANDLISFQKKYHPVTFIVGHKKNTSKVSIEEIPQLKLNRRNKLLTFFEDKKQLQYIFQLRTFNFLKSRNRYNSNKDIVHFHNLHGGYFSPLELIAFSKKYKTIWTLHDMHAFTGHCSHAFECLKWQNGCGECPDLLIYPKIIKDSTAINWKIKAKVYQQIDTTLVVPSEWLAEKVRNSILGHLPLKVIYNGVDTKVFKAKDKLAARKKLGLPLEQKIIMFSADMGLSNPFKGGEYVLKMLKEDEFEGIIFINLGGEKLTKSSNLWSFPYLHDVKELVDFYNAADVLLYPSLADNCPLVVLEAMACGLPIVAFNVGGIPELVCHNETGFIVEVKNYFELKVKILNVLQNSRLRDVFAINSIKRVNSMFCLEKMNETYLKLYNS